MIHRKILTALIPLALIIVSAASVASATVGGTGNNGRHCGQIYRGQCP